MTNVLAFAAVSFVLIAVPGPSALFTISRALTVGRRGALLTVLGNQVGVYVQVAAVAVGVGAIVQRSVEAFTVLKLAGAAYLVYLGVQSFRHRKALTEALVTDTSPARTRRVLLDGFAVGVANPKTIVFFAAALPQFVDPAAGAVLAQMLILGTVHSAIALIIDGVWAIAADTARDRFARSPRRLAAIGGTGGVCMIGLGASLALTGRKA